MSGSSMWRGEVACPFPEDEDEAQTAWWNDLAPAYQERWAPLLVRLDARGRAFFHGERRRIRDGFKLPEGSPERVTEEDAAEERLFERVSAGIARVGQREPPTAPTPELTPPL